VTSAEAMPWNSLLYTCLAAIDIIIAIACTNGLD
jgi:hypothetical protein